MGRQSRTNPTPNEYGMGVQRPEIQREGCARCVPSRTPGDSGEPTPRYPESADFRGIGVAPSYQKFFCPQCGHGIPVFAVEVGDTGYFMEAVCTQCRSNVRGIVELAGTEKEVVEIVASFVLTEN